MFNWDEDETDTSGDFQIVTFNYECDGALEAVYGYNEVLTAGILKNSFQAVECAATYADTLSGAQERANRTLAVGEEQAAQIFNLGGRDGSWRLVSGDKIHHTGGLQHEQADGGVQGQAREDISGKEGQRGK
jgi:hypothetical protein